MGAERMMVKRYHSDPDFKHAGAGGGQPPGFVIERYQMPRRRLTHG